MDTSASKTTSPPRILQLNTADVNRICSGQVVTQLSTAVKELVENALDAHANTVEVKLMEYGAELIEVTDNGSGIKGKNTVSISRALNVNDTLYYCDVKRAEEDYEYVALKSATSKISNFEDIYGVSSFGFRGEALSALCELSESVTICTRTVDQAVGVELSFDTSGRLVSKKPIPRAVGTTVRVKSLFSRLPVRHREFLRSVKQQYAKLLTTLQAYGLSSPSTRLLVSNMVTGTTTEMLASTTRISSVAASSSGVTAAWSQEKLAVRGKKAESGRQSLLTTSGYGKLRDAIIDIFGLKMFETLDEYNCPLSLPPGSDEHPSSITGFVSKAGTGVGRQNNDKQFMFLNDRPVDLPKISKAINEVWRQYEMGHKPAYMLNLRIPSHLFDINIAPDKREVLLSHEAEIVGQLQAALHLLWEPSRRTFNSAPMAASLWSNSAPSMAASRASNSGAVSSSTAPVVVRGGDGKSVSLAEAVDGPTPDPQALPVEDGEDVVQTSVLETVVYSSATSSYSSDRSPQLSASPDRGAHRAVLASPDSPSDVVKRRQSILAALTKSGGPTKAALKKAHDITAIVRNRPTPTQPAYEDLKNAHIRSSDAPPVCADERVDRCCSHDLAATDGRCAGEPIGCEEYSETSAALEPQDVPSLEQFEASEPKVEQSPTDDGCIIVENDVEPEHSKPGLKRKAQQFVAHSTTHGQAEKVDIDAIRRAYNLRRERFDGHDLSMLDAIEATVVFGESAAQEGERSWNKRLFTSPTAIQRPEEAFSESDAIKPLSSIAGGAGSHSLLMCASHANDMKAKEDLENVYSRVLHKSNFIEMSRRVFGQFNLGFIVAASGSDLFILDQHACDEKFRFEYLQEHTIIHEQRLLVARPIDLTAAEEHCILENLNAFTTNGFHFEVLPDAAPGKRLRLSAVPFSKSTTFGDEDVRELASLLNESRWSDAMVRLPKATSMFASRACRSAVMIGTALSRDKMRKIVAQLSELQQPWNCPHGRPTLRHLIDVSHVPISLMEAGVDK